jgi:hypothetical protein
MEDIPLLPKKSFQEVYGQRPIKMVKAATTR